MLSGKALRSVAKKNSSS